MTLIETSREKLGKYLIRQQLITPDQLDVALREQQRHYRLLGDVLIDLGYLKSEDLALSLSQLLNLSYIDLNHCVVSADLAHKLPKEIAVDCSALIIRGEDPYYEIIMADPENLFHISRLQYFFGADVKLKFHLGQRCQIQAAHLKFYYGQNLVYSTDDSPRFLQQLLLQAMEMRASDLHIRPEQQAAAVLMRLDGVMVQHQVLHRDQWQRLLGHIKVLASLDLAENRRPQDGRFDLAYPGHNVNCRVSVVPTVNGESIVIRLLDQRQSLLTLEQLGFLTEQQHLLQSILSAPQGLFVIAGPTGSGKTTTLYALLNYLAPSQRNIVTLEEPVEYLIPGIRQVNIKSEILPFDEALRAILRHDPDVIYISEVRDQATAMMAFRAAMTGHLVLVTLHAGCAQQIPYRLMDLQIPLLQQAGSYVGLMSQRLLRCVCQACRGQGCESCFMTGYKGRRAVAEIMASDSELDNLLSRSASWKEFKDWFGRYQSVSLYYNSLKLLATKATNISEIHRVFGTAHE